MFALLSFISFLSAFLLFQLELILSKLILPHYGGSYLVWGAALVFFQLVLLAGYAWAHAATRAFGFSRYRYVQMALFAGTLLVFPGSPLAPVSPGTLPLVFDVFFTLLTRIGLVFFALTTVSVVLQCWVAASGPLQQRNPYPLYAASNLGSCAALLSYPFFIEPRMGLRIQLTAWTAGYFLLVALFILAFVSVPVAAAFERRQRPVAIPRSQKLTWFLWAFSASVFFMAVSNMLAYDIAPTPFIWVAPLAVYLFSFVLVFRDRPLVPQFLLKRLDLVCAAGVLVFVFSKTVLTFWPVIWTYLLVLLAMCVVCHGRMYLTRPHEKASLTDFYLFLAAGGAAGGIFVTWLAPRIFPLGEELLAGMVIALSANAVGAGSKKPGAPDLRLMAYGGLALILWPAAYRWSSYMPLCAAVIAGLVGLVFMRLRARPFALALWGLAVLGVVFSQGSVLYRWRMLEVHRNYYGMYRIARIGNGVFMYNGNTVHGGQNMERGARHEAVPYYHHLSPIWELLSSPRLPLDRVAVIGLGSGGLASFGRQGQAMDFFEIDPDTLALADRYFSFLRDSPARIRLFFGDARIRLRQCPPGTYDMLIMDAFSGDNAPVHLMTVEALQEYRRLLAPQGTIVLHISNRLFNFEPVVFSNARSIRAQAFVKRFRTTDEYLERYYSSSVWCALTWDPATARQLKEAGWEESPANLRQPPWTDDYSSLLHAVKGPFLRALQP